MQFAYILHAWHFILEYYIFCGKIKQIKDFLIAVIQYILYGDVFTGTATYGRQCSFMFVVLEIVHILMRFINCKQFVAVTLNIAETI